MKHQVKKCDQLNEIKAKTQKMKNLQAPSATEGVRQTEGDPRLRKGSNPKSSTYQYDGGQKAFTSKFGNIRHDGSSEYATPFGMDRAQFHLRGGRSIHIQSLC
jgi:hypothetical protein